MAFTLSERLVRELSRSVARRAQTNATSVTAELDKISDAIDATGIQNGRVISQANMNGTSVSYMFPEDSTPSAAKMLIEEARHFCYGLDAAGVLSALDAIYAVKRQRVTAISTVGMPL